MIDDKTQIELNRRNIAALMAAADQDRMQMFALIETVRGLRQTVAQQAQQLQILQQQVAAFVAARGNGRTAG